MCCWLHKVWCGVVYAIVMGLEAFSYRKMFVFLAFVRYTALHYTVERMNLLLLMECLCKYHNSVTNLVSLFQQLKSIGSGILKT
jgi:hypothetical protein